MDIQVLKDAGIDYEEGLKRFANNAKLYEKYLVRFKDEKTFSQLEECIAAKDYKTAFPLAHSLKGITGNLSMDELYKRIYDLTEELRTSPTDKAIELFALAKIEYDRVIAVLNA